MYAMFINGSYELIFESREAAIADLKKMFHDLGKDRAMRAIRDGNIHIARMEFVNGMCSLGYEPNLCDFEYITAIDDTKGE